MNINDLPDEKLEMNQVGEVPAELVVNYQSKQCCEEQAVSVYDQVARMRYEDAKETREVLFNQIQDTAKKLRGTNDVKYRAEVLKTLAEAFQSLTL